MTCVWPPCKVIYVLTLIFVTLLPRNRAYDIHNVVKRQIGVLARTGALPQGKRSVEVLARNGELPQQIGSKKESTSDFQSDLDLLIRELESAESLSRLRLQALTQKVLEEKEAERNKETQKRSVAALARNGELPQKRLPELSIRSGYLVKPQQETVQSPPDVLDPDDFLADGQSSVIPEYSDEKEVRIFFQRPEKRFIGSARRLLLPGKNLECGTNSYSKKNLASLARDGGFSTIRQHIIKERRVDDNLDLAESQEDDRKYSDDSRNFIKRKIQGMCSDRSQKYGNKNLIFEVLNKDNSNRNNREADLELEEYPAQKKNEPDYEDFYNNGNPIEKRFLGRIPQLGRIHQKVQSPSARRRPHLRPNWL